MLQPNAPKDIEKMVEATAKVMALAEYRCGTPRMVKLYMDEARRVLLDVARAAKRLDWTSDELIRALKPPRRPARYWEREADPSPRGGPSRRPAGFQAGRW
jgi:hypothetical protein